uniref:Uncharacterized protein n=1 Tax=Arundo donax TaxID=35708 RepID=A0A0A9C988_ARUDO
MIKYYNRLYSSDISYTVLLCCPGRIYYANGIIFSTIICIMAGSF